MTKIKNKIQVWLIDSYTGVPQKLLAQQVIRTNPSFLRMCCCPYESRMIEIKKSPLYHKPRIYPNACQHLKQASILA